MGVQNEPSMSPSSFAFAGWRTFFGLLARRGGRTRPPAFGLIETCAALRGREDQQAPTSGVSHMRHLALGMLTIAAVACGQNSPPIQATVRVQADSTRNGRYQVVTTPQTVQTNQTMLL